MPCHATPHRHSIKPIKSIRQPRFFFLFLSFFIWKYFRPITREHMIVVVIIVINLIRWRKITTNNNGEIQHTNHEKKALCDPIKKQHIHVLFVARKKNMKEWRKKKIKPKWYDEPKEKIGSLQRERVFYFYVSSVCCVCVCARVNVCSFFYWNFFLHISKCSRWKESLNWKQWIKDETKSTNNRIEDTWEGISNSFSSLSCSLSHSMRTVFVCWNSSHFYLELLPNNNNNKKEKEIMGTNTLATFGSSRSCCPVRCCAERKHFYFSLIQIDNVSVSLDVCISTRWVCLSWCVCVFYVLWYAKAPWNILFILLKLSHSIPLWPSFFFLPLWCVRLAMRTPFHM